MGEQWMVYDYAMSYGMALTTFYQSILSQKQAIRNIWGGQAQLHI